METETVQVRKNVDGHLGPICNNCGGYGFTLSANGSKGCLYCEQTGIELPSKLELLQRIEVLEKKVG